MKTLDNRFIYLGIVFFLVGLFLITPAAGAEEKKNPKFRVLLDPAHGGEDRGIRVGNRFEKDIVLVWALGIRNQLRKNPNIEVILTREDDRNLSSSERVALGRQTNPGLLVSLHINAAFGKAARGWEVFFPGFAARSADAAPAEAIVADMAKNRQLNDSVRFVRLLQKNMEPIFPRHWRDLRAADFPLFEKSTYPVVIIEIGFATNPDDAKMLGDEKVQTKIISALVDSIEEFAR